MSTKEKIIASATTLFSKNGFAGTSVRDICEDADVADSAIHYHFKSKDGLLQEILEQFGQKHLSFSSQTLSEPKSLEELKLRVRLFLEQTISSLQEQTEVFRLVLVEIEKMDPTFKQTFENSFLPLFNLIRQFIENGKHNDIVRKEIDSTEAAGFLINQITGQLRLDHVYEQLMNRTLKNADFHKLWLDQTTDIFCGGIT